MNIGEPLKIITCTPEKLPIPEPEFTPDREVPVEEPQKVTPDGGD
jgi:hypothetical protein